MKVINVILKVISGCLYFVGFLFLIGSEGAMKFDNIDFKQLGIQVLIAAGICLVGYIINRLREYFIDDYLYDCNYYDCDTWKN